MAQKTTTRLPTIGAVVRAWRLFRGMSSTELADKAPVRIAYLSEIEHDRTINPKEEYLVKLADALEVPLKDILGRRMPPEKGEDDEAVEEEEQARGAPTYSMANTAKPISYSPSSTTGGKVDRRMASGQFSEEEEEEVEAAILELIDRFISFKETQRKNQEED